MLDLVAASVEELSKEKPSADNVDFNTKDFIKLLDVRLLPCLLSLGPNNPPQFTFMLESNSYK